MIPARTPNLPWRSIGARCIVIHPRRGEVHELDELGSFLWLAADGTRELEEICQELVSTYEIETAQALDDAREFYARIEALGLATCRS